MKIKLLFICLVILKTTFVFGQIDSIKSFSWSANIYYNYKNQQIIYLYDGNEIIKKEIWNKTTFYYLFGEYYSIKKKPKISKEKLDEKTKINIINASEYYINNLNNSESKFIFTNNRRDSIYQFIDSIYNKYSDNCPINKKDVSIYLTDTLIIKLNEFKTNYSYHKDSLVAILDGISYTIDFFAIKINGDTIKSSFDGYFSYLRDTEIDDFIIYDLLTKKYSLFNDIPIRYIFNEENYFCIVLRYMSYVYNKIDRKNIKSFIWIGF